MEDNKIGIMIPSENEIEKIILTGDMLNIYLKQRKTKWDIYDIKFNNDEKGNR